ncbi:MAG TPA: M60 family metallopeptidase, partial [Chthonomonadaceae bacterium]|nr:M60 family metallopeptidase [Chthonomonadaceae bacterium]
MRLFDLLMLLALCLPVNSAWAQDRADLLEGVQEVVAPGGIPGDLVVFGDQALVVLTGKRGGERLPLIAAGRYGQGRAVAVGHEAFFGSTAFKIPDNVRLVDNIAQWAGNRPLKGLPVGLMDQDTALASTLSEAGCRVRILKAGDLPGALAQVNVLWLNQASLDGGVNRARIEAVQRWIQAGGGLVEDGPGWGWQETHPGQDLARDQSANRLLRPLGIAFSGAMLEPTGKEGFTTGEDDVWLTQANLALEALEAHAAGRETLTAPQVEQATTTLAQALRGLPESQSGFVCRVETLCADQGDVIPTKEKPITREMPFARLKAVLDWQRLRRLPPDQVTAHPAAASFPGAVPAGAPRETRKVTIDTHVPEWHCTGLYAAPGEVVTTTLPAAAAGKGLQVRIGAHTDRLWELDRWERFPEITLTRPLEAPVTRIASAFGGLLYIVVPPNCRLGVVPVRIAHVVAAPRFLRGVTRRDDWQRALRTAPAPWAELEGRKVILTLPSSVVRHLDDPEPLLAYWDQMMSLCYAFFAAPERPRPERYCVDRQISAGYMHSGYPIMTGEDVAKTFCDLGVLRGPEAIRCWGFYHEMGHNFQQPEWTWDDFGEVTNNLFSLYASEKLNGVAIGAHPAMTAAEIARREQAVAAAPGEERYYAKDPWYPLTMFFLLRRQF